MIASASRAGLLLAAIAWESVREVPCRQGASKKTAPAPGRAAPHDCPTRLPLPRLAHRASGAEPVQFSYIGFAENQLWRHRIPQGRMVCGLLARGQMRRIDTPCRTCPGSGSGRKSDVGNRKPRSVSRLSGSGPATSQPATSGSSPPASRPAGHPASLPGKSSRQARRPIRRQALRNHGGGAQNQASAASLDQGLAGKWMEGKGQKAQVVRSV